MVRPNPVFGDARLAQRLRQEIAGEVLFSPADRGRYATDASIYQVKPIGVVVPRRADDVAATLAIAAEFGVPVLARGAGTSQAGQAVNRAIVIDCSRHLDRILRIDAEARTAEVEAGLVLGTLNAALRPHGLYFPVDPVTQSRCTIGGMAGNNASGAHSLRHGLMADNVAAIDALLADGTRYRFGDAKALPPRRITALTARLQMLGSQEAAEIAARFPWLPRRVGGYNLETLTPAAKIAGGDNLARLLVGSEGTLAVSLGLTLRLAQLPARKVLGVCQFADFRTAMQAMPGIIELEPDAVELVGAELLALLRADPRYRRASEVILAGEPKTLLLVEFQGETDAALARKLMFLDEVMEERGHPGAVVPVTDTGLLAEVAQMHEAGVNALMVLNTGKKPVAFVEDAAVPLEDLPEYTERLDAVFARHGTRGSWYGHAALGCLHVRPLLNLKYPAEVSAMRAIADEVFSIVRAYQGSHSSESGDGILRSEFHTKMFGARIVRAFETVKDDFDPDHTLNPNRIVHAPRMDDPNLLRYRPDYAPLPQLEPVLDWSVHHGALLGAVEMCDGNGACRGFDTEVMCPSFRATRNESDVTRGRANTLRLALTGQLPGGLAGEDVREAMALCVACKACRTDCPNGIDMARMKIEVMAARTPGRRENLFAALPQLAAGKRYARFAALRNKVGLLRRMGEKRLGISADRPLPVPHPQPFRDEEAQTLAPARERGAVYLFVDTFSRWFEPETARATLRVLAAAGYRAILPPASVRPLCCGRMALGAGRIDRARAEARRVLRAFVEDLPVIGIEPSCLLTLRDEFLVLHPNERSRSLAARAMLLGEFLAKENPDLRLRDTKAVAHMHGHCHQKSFQAFLPGIAALSRIPGLDVRPIRASCCGMAGAFGYQAETQAASRAMAELGLLPAVRAAARQDILVADGAACRQQIWDLSGKRARHSAVLLAEALAK